MGDTISDMVDRRAGAAGGLRRGVSVRTAAMSGSAPMDRSLPASSGAAEGSLPAAPDGLFSG
ncbi:MAG TPA: hypothetical protein PK597_01660 [Oscillospiraceae bacterium]|nr:hypothetical protein [Oscillospiraceae bacterium]